MITTPPLQHQGGSPLGSDSCSPLRVLHGDCREILKSLPDGSVQCCVTSPPYWGLRDYGHQAQIGHEETPFAFVEALTEVFAEVRRVLKDDGTLWLNLGDTYSAGCMTGKQGANGITGNRAQNTTPLPPRKTAGWDVQNLPRKTGDPLGCLQWTDFRTGRVRRWTVRIGDRIDRVTLHCPDGRQTASHGWSWIMTHLRGFLCGRK